MASILKREEMAKMIDGKGKRRRGSPRSCAVVHVELWISGSCPFERDLCCLVTTKREFEFL